MRKKDSIARFCLIICVSLIPVWGYSTTKALVKKMDPRAVVKKIMPTKPDLKKRIMVFPFVDRAGLGPAGAAKATSDFANQLAQSRYILVFDAPGDLRVSKWTDSFEYGVLTHPALIRKAREMGMNALVTGIVGPIESTTRKTGIWGFRKLSRVYELSVVVNVVDVNCGTLFLTSHESEEEAFPVDDVEFQDERGVVEEALRQTIPRLLKGQASKVDSHLAKEPWAGTILSVQDNRIRINAGKDLGVEPGKVFTVFAKGESLHCQNGKSIEIIGKKIGEVRATEVMEKESLAVPLKDGAFITGQMVRSRP